MSLDYAKALSAYENKGKCGMPEKFDSDEQLDRKCAQLAHMLRTSKCCVVLTGAGISTAAGIPDFRGPNGVWTLEKRNQDAHSVSFERARPTFTHFALCELERRTMVRWLITQNVDSLHAVAGFPMNRMAELHGNVFAERCDRCDKRYFRSSPIPSIGLKPTGRYCTASRVRGVCRGKLRDTTLDWEDGLPEPEYHLSQQYARKADLMLCLGTTLQINPVGDLPLLCKRNGGKLVTVNLQRTKHEKKVDLVINGRLDAVFARVMSHLAIDVRQRDVSASQGPEEVVVWKSAHPLEALVEEKKPIRKKRMKEKEEPEEEERKKHGQEGSKRKKMKDEEGGGGGGGSGNVKEEDEQGPVEKRMNGQEGNERKKMKDEEKGGSGIGKEEDEQRPEEKIDCEKEEEQTEIKAEEDDDGARCQKEDEEVIIQKKYPEEEGDSGKQIMGDDND